MCVKFFGKYKKNVDFLIIWGKCSIFVFIIFCFCEKIKIHKNVKIQYFYEGKPVFERFKNMNLYCSV